jgi:hypothetical protein
MQNLDINEKKGDMNIKGRIFWGKSSGKREGERRG